MRWPYRHHLRRYQVPGRHLQHQRQRQELLVTLLAELERYSQMPSEDPSGKHLRLIVDR